METILVSDLLWKSIDLSLTQLRVERPPGPVVTQSSLEGFDFRECCGCKRNPSKHIKRSSRSYKGMLSGGQIKYAKT